MKITIITVSFNAEETIGRTLESVKKNKDSDLEYVVVDGDSKDGTKSIIENYRNIIDCYICEKDDGIYDALNKGIRNANGEWVMLLAADDELLPGALNNFIDSVKKDTQIWCGSIIAKKPYGYFMEPSDKDLNRLNYECSLRNPATFFKKRIFDEHGYYMEKYRCNGDRELFLRMYLKGVKFQIEDIPIVLFSWGGISTNNSCDYAIPESKKISIKYGIMNEKEAAEYYDSLLAKEEKKHNFRNSVLGKAVYRIMYFEPTYFVITKIINKSNYKLTRKDLLRYGIIK